MAPMNCKTDLNHKMIDVKIDFIASSKDSGVLHTSFELIFISPHDSFMTVYQQ
jgi:hypothetical protein